MHSLYQNNKKAYQNFQNTIKSPKSLNLYCRVIHKYFEFVGLDSDTCYKLLEKDKKEIESDITSFLVYLRNEQKKGYLATKNYYNAIKHFYHINYDDELKWSRIKMYLGDDDDENTEKDRPYTMEEIRILYSVAHDLRAKAIVSLLTSTGMRVEGLIDLRVGNLTPIDKYNIYKVQVYAKSKYSYFTFCSPEARRDIDRYLEYRTKCKETITSKSPVIRNSFNSVGSEYTKIPKPLQTCEAVFKILSTMLKRDALLRGEGRDHEKEKNRYPVKAVHGFRKFFITTAAMNGMHPDWVDLLTGHKLPGVRGAYFKPTPEQLLEGTETVKGYKDIIDSVTINEENKLRKEIHELKINQDKMLELAAKVAEVEQYMKSLKKK
ncbi:MAG: hypothetical protein ACPKPY_11380 [Nitrososphaeraceae archaeon]